MDGSAQPAIEQKAPLRLFLLSLFCVSAQTDFGWVSIECPHLPAALEGGTLRRLRGRVGYWKAGSASWLRFAAPFPR